MVTPGGHTMLVTTTRGAAGALASFRRLEPASHVIWTSAISLASSPRPYVRLLALNTGRWPRRISEDRLIPDHIIPLEELDPLPIADGDRRDYATIVASARSIAISFSRRDVEGRLLGLSPLIGDQIATYLIPTALNPDLCPFSGSN
jgi:hypothetical protein